jgi:hypothetical protein
MNAIVSSDRQIAVTFAGALLTSLLFVSAAVGPLPFFS